MKIYQDLIAKTMTEMGLRRVKGADISDEPDALLKSLSPIITVSRDPGSGGKPIAQALAKKLGFKFYDKELVDKIAKSAKMRRSLLDEIDEKGRTLMTDFVHQMLNPDYVSDIEYMRHLCKVVLSIAYKGKAVILGRGANFITPLASGFHVRIVAAKNVRIKRAMKYDGLTSSQAKKEIGKVEKDREDFIKQYFDEKIGDLDFYDMILNTTFYNIEQASKVIETGFRQKFTKGTM
jgi:cytidylate kinase